MRSACFYNRCIDELFWREARNNYVKRTYGADELYGLLFHIVQDEVNGGENALRAFAQRYELPLEIPSPSLPPGFTPYVGERILEGIVAENAVALVNAVTKGMESSNVPVAEGKVAGCIRDILMAINANKISEALVDVGGKMARIAFGGICQADLRPGVQVVVALEGSRLVNGKKVRKRNYNFYEPYPSPNYEPFVERITSEGVMLSWVEFGAIEANDPANLIATLSLHRIATLRQYELTPGTSLDNARYLGHGYLEVPGTIEETNGFSQNKD